MTYWLDWAEKRPLARNFTNKRRSRTDGIILHVAASEAASLHGWFSNPAARASSHLYVRRDGTVEQYVDLDHISWASLAGDARCLSVETQGQGHGSWTPEQVASLVRIIAETAAHYGYPLRVMASSKTSEKGVGWHRQGVPLNVAQKQRGISQTGGELWSGAAGKICPGPERIPQIPGIVAKAKTETVKSNPPIKKEGAFMALTDAEQKELLALARKNESELRKVKAAVGRLDGDRKETARTNARVINIQNILTNYEQGQYPTMNAMLDDLAKEIKHG